jgi:hypothetical protein
MTAASAVMLGFKPEEPRRRFWEGRRLRAALAYGFIAIALGLAVTDVCRLTLTAGPSVSQPGRLR